MEVVEIQYVERGEKGTNALSAWLLDRAGNPFGTYEQEEPCGHCGAKLIPPPPRSLIQKICTKAAYLLRNFQMAFAKDQASWIHILFQKK